ncbi:MAG: GWxTD domain-containing protein [Calditrichaeota bacterium]|nr:GWxTD domain-containing protein [Calditrichota bacterium]
MAGLWALAFAVGGWAVAPAAQQGALRLNCDWAAFKELRSAGATYQEVYLGIPHGQLRFSATEGGWLAGYSVRVRLLTGAGQAVGERTWQSVVRADSLQDSQRQTSLEVVGFVVHEDSLLLDVEVEDLNSGMRGSLQTWVQVPTFADSGLQMSEVELAGSIERAVADNPFVKSGFQVLPNPSRIYGLDSPFLYFYCELYNLVAGQSCLRQWSVVDDQGNPVHAGQRSMRPRAPTAVWAEKINLLGVASGRYVLRLAVTDSASGATVQRETPFWFSNPAVVSSPRQLDEQQAAQARAQLTYLVSDQELRLFDQLDAQAKARYVASFWAQFSPQFRLEHLRRFDAANRLFGSPTTPGWQSDRGRVYIMYGPPDEVEREPASVDTRAYEIWIYENLKSQGRVEFVFCDYGLYGNYRLVHCTLKSGERLEIYNPDWREEIRIAR